jgi:hypothetical protein
LGIVVVLILIPRLLRSEIDSASRGLNDIFTRDPGYKYIVSAKPANPWLELSVPFRQSVLTSFTPCVTDAATGCIDRGRYEFEFSRLVGLHPYRQNLSEARTLIVGASSDVGLALSRRLNDSAVRLSCRDVGALAVANAAITHAIVTCPGLPPEFATTDGAAWSIGRYSEQLRGIAKVLHERGIRFLFVTDGPISGDVGGRVIRIPLLRDFLGRVREDCDSVGRVGIEADGGITDVSDLTADDVADFVLSNIDNDTLPQRVELVGTHPKNLKKAVDKLTRDSRCSVSWHEPPHRYGPDFTERTKIAIPTNPALVSQSIPRADSPYLSIVVAVGDFLNRPEPFVDAIARGIARYPRADVELVVVDYGSSRFRETVQIPSELTGRTRIIEVPIDGLKKRFNTGLTAFEYIARNIGIRRARGSFVLSTSLDALLPSTFFALIAERDFNEGIVYRSARWETRPGTFLIVTPDELWQGIGEPWRADDFNLKERCPGGGRFVVSVDGLTDVCGAADFVLASRGLWEAVAGFNEVVDDSNGDAVLLAKFFKLAPGFAQSFIEPIVVHMRHEKERVKRTGVEQMEALIKEYNCRGTAKTKGDTHKWGHVGERFKEIAV